MIVKELRFPDPAFLKDWPFIEFDEQFVTPVAMLSAFMLMLMCVSSVDDVFLHFQKTIRGTNGQRTGTTKAGASPPRYSALWGFENNQSPLK